MRAAGQLAKRRLWDQTQLPPTFGLCENKESCIYWDSVGGHANLQDVQTVKDNQ